MSLSALLSQTVSFMRTHQRTLLISTAIFSIVGAVSLLLFPYATVQPQAGVALPAGAVTQKLTYGLLMALFGSFVTAYYYLIAIRKQDDIQKGMTQALPVVFPVIGIIIWTFIRSFVWVPIIVALLIVAVAHNSLVFVSVVSLTAAVAILVLALIFSPRFAFSTVILIHERKSIRDSVELSYKRTKGYWGKIMGNLIVVGIITVLLLIVFSIVAHIIGITGITFLSNIVMQFGRYISTAFYAVFVVHLAQALMTGGAKSRR